MSDYKIGKVSAVTGERIVISLLEHSDANQEVLGVPDDMTVDVVLPGEGPLPVLIGQPGTFVEVQIPCGRILAMVVDVAMKEGSPGPNDVRDNEQMGIFAVDRPSRSLSAVAVGTMGPDRAFERGTDMLPTVNASVFAVLPSTLESVFESYANGTFSLGRLSLIPQQKAKIDLDAFLGRHAAILGQTGGGKSWTVASVAQKIARFPQSTLVVLAARGKRFLLGSLV